MLIIGIDPGKTGALFALTEERQFHSAIPNLTTSSLIEWIETMLPPKKRDCRFYVEKAQSMPKQGVVSTFTYAEGFGELLGVIRAFHLPFSLIPPQQWVKPMLQSIPRSLEGKDRNAMAARQLFPEFNLLASPRCTKPHEGLVDALLIAEFGRRLLAEDHFINQDNILIDQDEICIAK